VHSKWCKGHSEGQKFILQVLPQFALDLYLQGAVIPGHQLKYPGGLVSHFAAVRDEFVESQNLQPIKIVISGPPCSGKSALASHLSKQYNLTVLSQADLLASAATADAQLAAAVSAALGAKGSGTLSANLKAQLCRHALAVPHIRNRGYILDGFPETLLEARELFTDAREFSEAELENQKQLAALMEEANEVGQASSKAEKGKKPSTPKQPAVVGGPVIEDVPEPRSVCMGTLPNLLVCLKCSKAKCAFCTCMQHCCAAGVSSIPSYCTGFNLSELSYAEDRSSIFIAAVLTCFGCP
jgi:hypothetical protein